ncbi:MAG: hypothetical protein QOD70_1988 [Frankiales bacterium]|nr:hypothetical protein [Frankiales bacterium]
MPFWNGRSSGALSIFTATTGPPFADPPVSASASTRAGFGLGVADGVSTAAGLTATLWPEDPLQAAAALSAATATATDLQDRAPERMQPG